MAPAMPHVKGGRVRALAVTGEQRSAAAPEIPTVAESGVPGYVAISWQGVLAPAGTPREVIQRLNAELVKIVNRPDTRKPLADQGYEPLANSPAEFASFIDVEIAKWTKVIRAAGIKAG